MTVRVGVGGCAVIVASARTGCRVPGIASLELAGEMPRQLQCRARQANLARRSALAVIAGEQTRARVCWAVRMVMIARLYVQLGEVQLELVATSAGRNCGGVAAVIGAGLAVLPLRPGRAFNAGLLLWIRDFRALPAAAKARLSGTGQRLRPFVPQADASYGAVQEPERHVTDFDPRPALRNEAAVWPGAHRRKAVVS